MCMFTVKQTFGRFDSYVPTSDQKSSLFELQLTIQFFSWVFPLLSAFTATCGCLGLNIQPPNVQETHTCVIVQCMTATPQKHFQRTTHDSALMRPLPGIPITICTEPIDPSTYSFENIEFTEYVALSRACDLRFVFAWGYTALISVYSELRSFGVRRGRSQQGQPHTPFADILRISG